MWANSSAISTASLLGNAAVLLGGLYLLSRSDEVDPTLTLSPIIQVLAMTDQLLGVETLSAVQEGQALQGVQKGVQGVQQGIGATLGKVTVGETLQSSFDYCGRI